MSTSEKTVSGLVQSQLPDFINADHPKFRTFVKKYYEWLEQNSTDGISNTAGNTIYHAMGIEEYRDIDQTPPEFIKYFKQELIPYFPENTSLSTEKILKSAREFYSKKGSEESIRWLFKVLFDEDVEITYPKQQILKTSDGKWIKPRAFRITVSETNKTVDVALLKKKKAFGSDSGATCIIESANRTTDPTNGIEIIEIYISNINKYFNNGEYIEIEYTDQYGVEKLFRERIIGTLSTVKVDSNIKTDPTQRRRGLFYNIGDPVVITGGLGSSAEANDGVAIVGNVSIGSIEGVSTGFPGYGYRLYSNSTVLVLRSAGDSANANLSTDLRIKTLNLSACTSNSQNNFIETVTYDKTVIDYAADTLIGASNIASLTGVNTRNIILNVTENDAGDDFQNLEEVWANGLSYEDALFKAKVATPNGNTKLSGTVSFLGDTALAGTVSVYGNTALTGTVSTNVSNWYITGSGTSFLTEVTAGEYVRVLDQMIQVVSVDSDTQLTLAQPFGFNRTSLSIYKANARVVGVGTSFNTAVTTADSLVINGETLRISNISNGTILTVTYPPTFTGSGYTAYKNTFSTTLAVVGNGTNFSALTAGQKLEVNGNRRVIANIANNYFLNVTSAYASTFQAQSAYRIGSFAAVGGPSTEYTGDILLYDVANTGDLTTILSGQSLYTKNTAKSFVINSITASGVDANANGQILQYLDFETMTTGGISLIEVRNGGGGFRSEPGLRITTNYGTQLSEQYNFGSNNYANTVQTLQDLGMIAHVHIENGGSLYSVNDPISFEGRGYGGAGYVQAVDANGAITSISLTDRGEGYLMRPNVYVTRAAPTYTAANGTSNIQTGSVVVIGTNANFTSLITTGDLIKIDNQIRKTVFIANDNYLTVNSVFNTTSNGSTLYMEDGLEATLTGYLFGDGAENDVITGAIGRVRDIRLVYRGYDYVSTPNVSLKVMDAVINPVPVANTFYETEYIYQGASLETSTFRANVKSLRRDTNVLRLYNYSGTLNTTLDLVTANGILCNVNTFMNVPAPSQYEAALIANGLPNPMYYGNGRAKAKAQYANGLIEFNGFYLNTDGFVSADKVLQDGEKYHNFSYEVQSEKALVEFETPIHNIGHPSGLLLVSKTVSKSEEDTSGYKIKSNVDLIMPGVGGSTVRVANSYSNAITGTLTVFKPLANDVNYASNTRVNVGDLFIINDGDRPPISKIVANVVSNTLVYITGDFIYRGEGLASSTLHLGELSSSNIVSGCTHVIGYGGTATYDQQVRAGSRVKIGSYFYEVVSVTNSQHMIINTGALQTATGIGGYYASNNQLVISGNIDPISVQAGDNVSFNIASANVLSAQTGNVEVFSTNTQVIGSGTTFTSQLVANDVIMVNNQLREVINIANNTHLNVNSSFSSNASGQEFFKRATYQNANVTVVVNDTITLNTSFWGNISNVVYLVAPNLNIEDHSYNVITLTAQSPF